MTTEIYILTVFLVMWAVFGSWMLIAREWASAAVFSLGMVAIVCVTAYAMHNPTSWETFAVS